MQTEPLAPNAHRFERGATYTVVTATWTHSRVRYLRTVGDAHLFVAESASSRKTRPDFLINDAAVVSVDKH